MEIARVIPEELLDKFRSKKDLYTMLTKDRKYTEPITIYSTLLLTSL